MATPTAGIRPLDLDLCLKLLNDWARDAEQWWYSIPGQPGLGCYGTGYNSWGVQTNQKYLAALAAVSEFGGAHGISDEDRTFARERALASLRFSLWSHVEGAGRCTDGSAWGHTWISALGVERMMFAVDLLEPHFSEHDHAALRAILTSEATWLHTDLVRGNQAGIVAGEWNSSGKNVPESNLWNGALLWRTALRYPDHPSAAAWREQACVYFVNSISIAADADDQTILDGKPISERHVGANFFPNYALDHHGYLNVGYQVICLSNAAMLHFDLKARGDAAPDSLYLHSRDLWNVVRKTVFSDGRLARIGGDSRVRYAYCQEYLLPSLVYAMDCLGEQHAAPLLSGQLELIRQEAEHNGDGSFYGDRLTELRNLSPYYYTRLESDRACAIGQLVCYLQSLDGGPARAIKESETVKVSDFEESVKGGWAEPEHGAALHRSPTRLASFAWRAYGLTQGFCLPPDDGHLVDWTQNLAGLVRFLGDAGVNGGQTNSRKLQQCHLSSFEGGFVTCGEVTEGISVTLAEGWKGAQSASHRLCFAALPDDHTVVGLQLCRTASHRTYLGELKGLHLNLPNDLFNGFERTLTTPQGEVALSSPPTDEIASLGGRWACLEGRLGVVGIEGEGGLVVHRSAERRGGHYHTLFVDEICFGYRCGPLAVDPETDLLDTSWAVAASVTAAQTEALLASARRVRLPGDLRGVRLTGLDGRNYLVIANLGLEPATVETASLGSLKWQRLDGVGLEPDWTLAAVEAVVLVEA